MTLKPGLYIVATPIGNLDDITHRAINILTNSNYIFCEDTRTTSKILQKHQIAKKKLEIYNDHSGDSTREKIASMIDSGMVISLVSDAGTPTISDPGYKLIRSLQEAGYYVDFIPGPCALIAGLVLSSMPSDKFYFGGFMPRTSSAKHTILKNLENLDATLIFYEGPSRIIDTLEAIKFSLGNREVAVARELTKMFQEVVSGKVDEVLAKADTLKLKGEFVLLIDRGGGEREVSSEEVNELIKNYLKKGLSAKDISIILKQEHHIPISRNEIYKIIDN